MTSIFLLVKVIYKAIHFDSNINLVKWGLSDISESCGFEVVIRAQLGGLNDIIPTLYLYYGVFWVSNILNIYYGVINSMICVYNILVRSMPSSRILIYLENLWYFPIFPHKVRY